MKVFKLILVFFFTITLGNFTINAQEEHLKDEVPQNTSETIHKGETKNKIKVSSKHKERTVKSKDKVAAARERLERAKKNATDGAMTQAEKTQRAAKIAKAEERLKSIEKSIDKEQQKAKNN